MNVRPLLILPAALAALIAPVAAADAAPKRTTSYPTITKIAPLKLAIGEAMVITGRNFVPGREKNTVVFKRDKQRAIFAKAVSATTRRLTVVVPEKLRPYLAKKADAAIPTKFRIRVLSRRFGKTYTRLDRSPTVAPAAAVTGPPNAGAPGEGGPAPLPPSDCDSDGMLDAVDDDDDNDGMTDQFEAGIRTLPCSRDSDGDGMWDTWEYESAFDLNYLANAPYPGKRPHPNPLDGGDAMMDWDGDGLWQHQEHALWQAGGRPSVLNYSDGDQTTGPSVDAPTGHNAHLDDDLSGHLTDDEKDFDGDRLSNWVEVNGPLWPKWWLSVKPYRDETPYFNTYDQTDYLDRDTDGDGVDDGDDDQDFDGRNNVDETWRGPYFVHPFNPCLPNPASRSCADKVPAYLDKPYPPFDRTDSYLYDHDGDDTTPYIPRPTPLEWIVPTA